MHEYIREKLTGIEEMHRVRILVAIESGSRAWGFPSTDSDYDVRFIYVRPQEDYLSIRSQRDVIETPLVHDAVLGVPLDFNGWDLRKALQLALKSNPVLVEWLVSPVRYQSDAAAASELLTFVREIADLEAFKFHYDRLARNAWDQILESSSEVKAKLYFYALRPAMCLQWIRKYDDTPPMDLPSLCTGVIRDEALQREIHSLVALKTTLRETDTAQRNDLLDSFIESVLVQKSERPAKSTRNEIAAIERADELFRKIVLSER